jgi:hypothetical protein
MNPFSLALRICVSFTFLLSSLWALLAYVPFTYQQVHKGGLVPALNAFGRAQPVIFWIALLAVAVIFCLEPLPRGPRQRRAMRVRAMFWYIHVPLAVFFTAHPIFGVMENGTSSYVWALAMFEPILFLTFVAIWEHWPAIQWGAKPAYGEPRLFMAACVSAVFLSLIYAGLANWRAAQTWTPMQRTLAVTSSLTAHLLVFAVLFVLLNLLTVVAGWFRNPQRALFLFCYAFGAWATFGLMTALVFPAISFSSTAAQAYAAIFGATLAMFTAGISVLTRQAKPAPVENGFDLALWVRNPMTFVAPRWWRGALAAVFLAAIAIFLAVASSKNDWNHLFQKLTALLIWVATFRVSYAISRWRIPVTRSRTGRLLILAFAVVPAQRMLEAGERSLWAKTGSQESFYRFLDSYAGFDPSFKLVHDSMSTVVVDASFFQFLARNTNLPRSAHIEPADIKLADLALPPQTEKPPNIFIFVVDSLRKDYLSPYNPNVDFTPNIQQFAADSVVMRNAFTRYGGTGLSEPSIWVGGAMIHKQYVTPFAPMDSLQKLIQAHDYQAFVTRDSILQTVVTPWPKLKELDTSSETMELDFCHSLNELASNLDASQNGPVFAYTQPQNIHISVISRQGAKSIDNGEYHNFYAPYASRLRRVDGCFGGFLQTLKTRGLYDNSFIVFTADHGDSLGEQGRWGHAYTIFPEIMRIPLIIHLPKAWQQKYQANPDTLSFNSDVTPSLYYLLGHRPVQNNELLGKPLFAEHREELNAYSHENYLVSSSYAAVYGILSGEGRFLYTADAVNLKESWFDLSEPQPSARDVTSSMRVQYEKMIREKIGLISQEYKFPPQ